MEGVYRPVVRSRGSWATDGATNARTSGLSKTLSSKWNWCCFPTIVLLRQKSAQPFTI